MLRRTFRLRSTGAFVPPATEKMAVVYSEKEITETPRRHPCLTARFPASQLRNICIIAHVDHGKSTLSDAILKRGGAIPDEGREIGTFTDKLQVEKERGITVKSQCCTFFVRYRRPNDTATAAAASTAPTANAAASEATPEPKSSSSSSNNPPPPPPIDPDIYCFNLIDTPGHVDFAFEVARCLHATEGAVVLVDANQGVQAQTVANLYQAVEANQTIIPCMSKLDSVMSEEKVVSAMTELEELTGVPSAQTVMTAARSRRGIEDLLRAVIERVPPPKADRSPDARFRGLIIDSWIENALSQPAGAASTSGDSSSSNNSSNSSTPGGASEERLVILVKLCEGGVRRRDVVQLLALDRRFTVLEVGILYPNPLPVGELVAGQMGYLVISALPLTSQQQLAEKLKKEAQLLTAGTFTSHADMQSAVHLKTKHFTGDTVFAVQSHHHSLVKNWPSSTPEQLPPPVHKFRPLRPVVFASFFPDEGSSFEALLAAIEGLRTNEPTITVQETKCETLGRGLVLGFQGQLQAQVFEQRLADEFDTAVLVTPASVFYKYVDKEGVEHDLTPTAWVERHDGAVKYLAPVVNATIVTPSEFQGEIIALANSFRAEVLDTTTLDDGQRCTIRIKIQLQDLIRGFFSELKALSHGYAGLEQDDPTYEEADLVKIDIIVNKAKLSALSTIAARDDANQIAKRLVSALKENLRCGIISMPIQALVGNKIIARETVSARRNDVAARVKSGGDKSRKDKLIENQKKAKKKLAKRLVGQVSIDTETLLTVMGATRL